MKRKIESLKDFSVKYAEILCILILAFFSYLFLFLNLGNYPLIDIDETRYVQIAREMFNSGNCVTPFLNFVPFLEKPPLYFWLSSLSFSIFGEFSIFAARFANALIGMFAVFFTYFFGRKALGKSFGLISALILLTNVWFLIFSHIAILDLGFMALIMASIYCAQLVNFCKVERNKKVCWYFFYIFMGLSVLSKGLIGFLIPFGTIFMTSLVTKNLKEMFKPVNILPGILLFLLVTVPWHYMVWAQNGQAWVDMYIIKHHLARFFNSGLGLGRKQPFLFYVPIILVGFLPWVINLISFAVRLTKLIIKDVKAAKSLWIIFTTDVNNQKILVYSGVWAVFGFFFFSVSSTKLPTYILAIFPALALLCGYYWWGYIMADRFSKGIKISSSLTSALFLLTGILALVVPKFIVKPEIAFYIEKAGSIIAPLAWLFIIVSVLSILFIVKKRRILLFASYIVLMYGIITVATVRIFPFITEFGQSELQHFAQIAKDDSNSALVTFDFPAKYGILNVYEKQINYVLSDNFDDLQKSLDKSKNNYIIVKNKHYETYKDKFKKFKTVEMGVKYTLLEYTGKW